MNHYIVGMGEALWDMLPDGKKIGGAPANFAFHVSQFGLQSCVISAIGPDSLGREILRDFTDKGLTHILPEVPHPTGTVTVDIDPDGIPRYDIRENVAWDNIPFTDQIRHLARHTRAFCFGSLAQRCDISRRSIAHFIDALPTDAIVIFDVNLRQHFYTAETLRSSMERCNILKINDEELVTVGRLFDIPGIDLAGKCRRLIDIFSLDILILTCGVNGSYIFTPDTLSFLPTPRVDVVDTVGAGDSFTAAFTASLLRGCTITRAHETAVAVSAYVCTCHGAMPRLPDTLTRM